MYTPGGREPWPDACPPTGRGCTGLVRTRGWGGVGEQAPSPGRLPDGHPARPRRGRPGGGGELRAEGAAGEGKAAADTMPPGGAVHPPRGSYASQAAGGASRAPAGFRPLGLAGEGTALPYVPMATPKGLNTLSTGKPDASEPGVGRQPGPCAPGARGGRVLTHPLSPWAPGGERASGSGRPCAVRTPRLPQGAAARRRAAGPPGGRGAEA